MSEFAAGSVKTFNNTFKHQPASDVHQLPHDYYQSLIRDDWDLAEDSLSEWTQTFELSAKGSDDVMDKQSIKPKSRSKVNEDKVKEAHHENALQHQQHIAATGRTGSAPESGASAMLQTQNQADQQVGHNGSGFVLPDDQQLHPLVYSQARPPYPSPPDSGPMSQWSDAQPDPLSVGNPFHQRLPQPYQHSVESSRLLGYPHYPQPSFNQVLGHPTQSFTPETFLALHGQQSQDHHQPMQLQNQYLGYQQAWQQPPSDQLALHASQPYSFPDVLPEYNQQLFQQPQSFAPVVIKQENHTPPFMNKDTVAGQLQNTAMSSSARPARTSGPVSSQPSAPAFAQTNSESNATHQKPASLTDTATKLVFQPNQTHKSDGSGYCISRRFRVPEQNGRASKIETRYAKLPSAEEMLFSRSKSAAADAAGTITVSETHAQRRLKKQGAANANHSKVQSVAGSGSATKVPTPTAAKPKKDRHKKWVMVGGASVNGGSTTGGLSTAITKLDLKKGSTAAKSKGEVETVDAKMKKKAATQGTEKASKTAGEDAAKGSTKKPKAKRVKFEDRDYK